MVTRSCTAQIAADVAARYGCPVDPACVQILPVGATSIKLPVWNGTRLTDPDFKETGFPRTRGDRPLVYPECVHGLAFPPHPRG